MAEAAGRSWPALEITHPASLAPVSESLLTALHEFDVSGLEECGQGTWRVYFGSAKARDLARRVLGTRLSSASVEIRALEIPDERWAARNQADLRAIRIGGLTIAPPWDIPVDTPPDEVIVIEPSTGFGTGHHASTRLCLVALQDLVLTDRRVLDLGTGSGVLALAARRLGARTVTAVDIDPDALDAARGNLARAPDGRAIALLRTDLRDLRDRLDDVLVANITGAFLIEAAALLSRLVVPGGDLIIGGFTAEEEAAVRDAFRASSRVAARYTEESWVTLRMVTASGGSEITPDELQHGDRGE